MESKFIFSGGLLNDVISFRNLPEFVGAAATYPPERSWCRVHCRWSTPAWRGCPAGVRHESPRTDNIPDGRLTRRPSVCLRCHHDGVPASSTSWPVRVGSVVYIFIFGWRMFEKPPEYMTQMLDSHISHIMNSNYNNQHCKILYNNFNHHIITGTGNRVSLHPVSYWWNSQSTPFYFCCFCIVLRPLLPALLAEAGHKKQMICFFFVFF